MTESKLTGEDLENRINELGIEGTSNMNADQKRQAVAQAEQEQASDGNQANDDTLEEFDEDASSRTDDSVEDVGVSASARQNAELEHSQGGATTRDNAHDQGVPMLPGHVGEPVGPEDALGEGEKRGDYAGRALPNLTAHEVVPSDDPQAGQLVTNEDGGVDIAPNSKLVAQVPRMTDQGEVPGVKGGVGTDPRAAGVMQGVVQAGAPVDTDDEDDD
jgi:hypothetical protein